MVDFANKDIEFLSNREVINVLQSILREIDLAVSSGAHRSTTYLAVSAIEGLFGEILKLQMIQPSSAPLSWPKNKLGNPKPLSEFSLENREQVLKEVGALPVKFEELYAPVRVFRNYMHLERELKEQTPIAQSVAQLALACLNALIEMYGPKRFVAEQQWQLDYGVAQVPDDKAIHMPPNPGDHVSLLVSEKEAGNFKEITFRVIISPKTIFNFVYNYFSLDDFMAARIEGREEYAQSGYNGRLVCTKWRAWSISGLYIVSSEPDPQKREYIVRVVLDPPGTFSVIVDDRPLELTDQGGWDFDPAGKIGFMTELGLVSILGLKVQT